MDYLSFMRQYKIGPFAIFDSALAFIGMYLLAPLLSKLFYKIHIFVPKSSWLWFTMPLSIIFHLLFRQSTPLMKIVMEPSGQYFAKIVIVVMIVIGVKKCRFIK